MTARSKKASEPLSVELARKFTGYRSHPNRESAFGRETGYPGQPWAGSYVHEVLREAGLLETALISTASALGWYSARNRVFHENPEPGDLVFYAFPSTGFIGAPHVGLVTETVLYTETGVFRAIEGETASGLSRGNQDSDGVFERTRYSTDVLGFVRPRAPKPTDLRNLPDPSTVPVVRPTNFGKRSPARERAATAVQYALFDAIGTDTFEPGAWDGLTRSAFEAFLRSVGVYEEVGDLPSDVQLQILGEFTLNRYFTTPEIPA